MWLLDMFFNNLEIEDDDIDLKSNPEKGLASFFSIL